MPIIKQLWIYPIKSCRGVALDDVALLASGLEHDREMMIVNASNGRFVTQRSDSVLATISVALAGGNVILYHEKHGKCQIQKQYTQAVASTVWSRQVPAFDQGDDAAHFLSQIIGREVRLLATRPIDTLNAERQILFQDGRALHILTEATLRHVSQQLPNVDIDARRFRPNIVIGDNDLDTPPLSAFAEDNWQSIHTPSVTLAKEKLCERCNIPNINPDNLSIDKAVLKYLVTHRKINGKPCLGINARSEKLGRLAVGDSVSID